MRRGRRALGRGSRVAVGGMVFLHDGPSRGERGCGACVAIFRVHFRACCTQYLRSIAWHRRRWLDIHTIWIPMRASNYIGVHTLSPQLKVPNTRKHTQIVGGAHRSPRLCKGVYPRQEEVEGCEKCVVRHGSITQFEEDCERGSDAAFQLGHTQSR